MGCNKFYNSACLLVIFSFTILYLFSCSVKEKSDLDNTFYIELKNIKNDSLKKNIEKNIFGKGSFYKNKKLEIISLNYVTDNLPELHYFKNIEILEKDITDESKKIKIEFKGDFYLDSIKYSLQKYKYKNKQWVKISDLGDIKDRKKFVQPQNIIDEFVRAIVLNIVQYSYN